MKGKPKNDNKKLAIILLSMVVFMFAVAFASVPLYRLFCSVTGFGGTTKVADVENVETVERWITVRFNADTDPKLPWKFQPDQKQVEIKIGEPTLISYSAQNLSDEPVMGTAMYNVTPNKAGEYFYKVQCFCFEEQTLNPGEKVSMPVSFYIDPSIINDDNLDEVKTITLSYTFFKAKS